MYVRRRLRFDVLTASLHGVAAADDDDDESGNDSYELRRERNRISMKRNQTTRRREKI
jgi:hypothetical protein